MIGCVVVIAHLSVNLSENLSDACRDGGEGAERSQSHRNTRDESKCFHVLCGDTIHDIQKDGRGRERGEKVSKWK